jgi:diguanylate cyclase (GGDEF)-like protein/PAS domain S-box-containing protein
MDTDAPALTPRQPIDSGVSLDRLRQEHERLRYDELHLLAPFGYFVVGIGGAILQANLAGARMLGESRATIARHQLRRFVCPNCVAQFDAFFRTALNSGHRERCQLTLCLREPERTEQVLMTASVDGSGQACRVMVEPVEGRMALVERSEERFRRIVHCAGEGIWELDARGLTSFVNPRMAELLGYTIEEMLGCPFSGFLDEEGRALAERNLARRRRGSAERQELRFVRKDGATMWASVASNPIYGADGEYLGTLALVNDITRQRASVERIWQQANFDELTGLPNRHMFLDRLRLAMRKADREGAFLALLFVDLDHFKDVNDHFGHAMGDLLLAQAAQRISACVRTSDTIARLGGDEFTVVLAGLERASTVDRIAQSMLAALARAFTLGEDEAKVAASIGVALYPADGNDVSCLLDHADQAMYAAKHAGGNRHSYFKPEMEADARARARIGADLKIALETGQFELLYQPIVTLRTGAVHKAEALLRWRHPVRGLLAPGEFLPFAESNGLIVDIGDWVFREAGRTVLRWQREIDPAFQVSVNKSPLQFRRDAALYQNLLNILRDLNLPAQSIVIEIGEGVLMDGAGKVLERLRQYRAMGLQVALDHFGTGYSSLSHLKRYDIDYVKIDPSFASTIESDDGDLALCEAIIAMAHKLGLKVVAECVNTRIQRALLADAGCDYAQGFMLGEPMTAAEFESRFSRSAAGRPPLSSARHPGEGRDP